MYSAVFAVVLFCTIFVLKIL